MLKKSIVLFLLCALAFSSQMATAQVSDKTNELSTVQADTVSQQKSQTSAKHERGVDWLSVIFASSYLLGIFVLFPLVVYTNMHEKIIMPVAENSDKIKPLTSLTEEEINSKSVEVLEKIENSLTSYTDNDGVERITITKGKQARLMKRGLDYINTRLCPSESVINDRVEEFASVYADRTERLFSGSKWILGCAIGVLVFMGFVDISILFSAFGIIHIIGIIFYFMASRVPKYILEKRMETFGAKGKGLVGGIITALFAGAAAKHYVSINGGSWQRDHESEFSSNMMMLMLVAMAALIAGFMVALFGVLNFVMNYSTNFIRPFKSNDQWYTETFETVSV